MVMNLTSAGDHQGQEQDATDYALASWDRTARLCAIRLTEAVPAFVPVLWLILRR